MIDIIAKWVDGKLLCGPKKRRGMTKGEYLRAVHVCQEFNKIELKKGRGCESPPHDQRMIFRGGTSASTKR